MINIYAKLHDNIGRSVPCISPGDVAWGLLAISLLIVPSRAEGPVHPAGTFIPAGELARRIALSSDRLTGPGFPTYTPDFVLADVELSPSYERLYQNFSGDISGRYLDALCAGARSPRS